MIFLIFCNSYCHVKFTKVENLHSLYAQNLQKFLTCLKGAKKIKLMLLFWIDSIFFCFEHSFEPQFDSLWVFWYFVNVCNLIYSLDTLCQILFGGFMAACVLSVVPSNVIHLEKRWERVLRWSFSTGKEGSSI
jgi:hypothetical protein